jgi:head-tail adaptor
MTPQLNRKLTLEATARTGDAAHGFTETWQPLGVVWAEVKPGGGQEVDMAGLTVSSVATKVTLRAAPHGAPSRPVAGQRFRDGARVYRILAVTEADGAGRYLICSTREEEVSA